MRLFKVLLVILVGVLIVFQSVPSAAQMVFGEWRINVKPGMMKEYEQLIIDEGLPLFKKNARMVGWWKTLIGDLYQMTTIWEYDSIADFEEGVRAAENDAAFQRFAEKRDKLLDGEKSEFLKKPDFVPLIGKPITYSVIIHETHIVKQGHMDAYLDYWNKIALKGLAEAGFRIVGPFVQHSGDSDELLILVCFNNLAERDAKLGTFGDFSIAKTFGAALNEHIEGFHIRVLTPSRIQK